MHSPKRLLIGLLLVALLGLLAACAGNVDVAETPAVEQEATEPAEPEEAATSEPEPTEMVHEATATAEPEPTAEPEDTATSEPEPTETEEPEATEGGGSLSVVDQEVMDGAVTVPVVSSATDGWMVIHADAGGGPGPVIGFTPVTAGDNADVLVTIDLAGATETLHAMLHVDEGTAGAYEFPGADVPARDADDSVVMSPFAVTGLPADAVSVASQLANEENMVVVPAVRAAAGGWMVIHSDNNGSPGPVAGFAPVTAGNNYNVAVELDPAIATETLHAMLHIDAGTVGTYEFPGDDGPVSDAEGNVVMLPFQVVDMVSALDSEFVPQVLRVVAGTTVTWSNDGQLPHTVDADSGLFSSGELAPGDTFEFTFPHPGSYAYYCALHGGPGGAGMAGTIVVVPGE
jgi:plastocyanin